jgi:hypothetical protein
MNTIIAWTGAVCFLTSYSLLTFRKLSAQNILYQLLNVLGGLCLAINTFTTKDYASFFTNTLWIGIGLWGLYNRNNAPRAKVTEA